MVEYLNQNPIRIFEIEGLGSIAMYLYRVNQVYSAGEHAGHYAIHILRCSDDKSDVMNTLNRTRLEILWKLVNSQVIGAGGQIGIFRIGLPLHPHTQNGTVKIDGFTHVPDIEGDVPKT
jgi:hypothetical protein